MIRRTYQHLAAVYDQLQQDVDTKGWADFIQCLESRYSQRHGRGDGQGGRPLLLDLGCGTGSFCLEMAGRGYDPIGIDTSDAMLDQARRKASEASCADLVRTTPLFLQQDISRFELFGTVDLIVCLLDTLNHLIRPEQAGRVFRLCANYLNPGGVLIFDLASRRHLSRTLGRQLFYQDTDEYTLFWQNSYRSSSGISRSALTLFSRQADGRYNRQDETIVEKYYELRQVRQWTREAGLELVAHLGELAERPASAADERHFYVVRRPLLSEVVNR